MLNVDVVLDDILSLVIAKSLRADMMDNSDRLLEGFN